MARWRWCPRPAPLLDGCDARPAALLLVLQQCGTVNRVTILTDKFGNPKVSTWHCTAMAAMDACPWGVCSSPSELLPILQGFAYVEFLEVDAVQNAVLLDNSELRARQIKVQGSPDPPAAQLTFPCCGHSPQSTDAAVHSLCRRIKYAPTYTLLPERAAGQPEAHEPAGVAGDARAWARPGSPGRVLPSAWLLRRRQGGRRLLRAGALRATRARRVPWVSAERHPVLEGCAAGSTHACHRRPRHQHPLHVDACHGGGHNGAHHQHLAAR